MPRSSTVELRATVTQGKASSVPTVEKVLWHDTQTVPEEHWIN